MQDFITARRSEDFNPRPPRGERHAPVPLVLANTLISIHALREESDDLQIEALEQQLEISIHALREESDCVCNRLNKIRCISIHALREESDKSVSASRKRSDFNFNPRPPRGERHPGWPEVFRPAPFQSTPSARRATMSDSASESSMLFQSTPSARRATVALRWFIPSICRFQSTPSARRATGRSRPIRPLIIDFNPRPPRGERPRCFFVFAQSFVISIHALREESDCRWPDRR